ncbi:MAG: hypothetical protein KTR31_15805 [Myxococcales bacterium]|nr:hypothetical protein [Myxococcales bacterium]
MAGFDESLLAALQADPLRWPGPLQTDARQRLSAALQALPDEVASCIVAGLLDPERHRWARGALLGASTAAAAGVAVVGMATDDLLELVGPQGEALGLSPLGFDIPSGGLGDRGALRRLLEALDAALGRRRYVVHLRRPLPPTVDTDAIAMAVQLWLADLVRGASHQQHAHYDDVDVSVEISLVRGRGKPGRQLTIGPANTLERMHAVNGRVLDALERHEQSVGSLPVVMVLSANGSWSLPRGHVQLLLYGTPREVITSRRGRRTVYEAWFDPNRSAGLFADGRCRTLSSLWWVEPAGSMSDPGDPLGMRSWSHDNPWASRPASIPCGGARFRCVEVHPDTSARMQWDLP